MLSLVNMDLDRKSVSSAAVRESLISSADGIDEAQASRRPRWRRFEPTGKFLFVIRFANLERASIPHGEARTSMDGEESGPAATTSRLSARRSVADAERALEWALAGQGFRDCERGSLEDAITSSELMRLDAGALLIEEGDGSRRFLFPLARETSRHGARGRGYDGVGPSSGGASVSVMPALRRKVSAQRACEPLANVSSCGSRARSGPSCASDGPGSRLASWLASSDGTTPRRPASFGLPPTFSSTRSAETELWGSLPRDVLVAMEAWLEWISIPSGTVLIRQGDPSTHMFLLLHGRMAASIERDGEERWIRNILPGESVGEIGLLHDSPRTASVRAVRDSQLACLSAEGFRHLAAEHPQLMWPLTRLLVERLTSAERGRPRRDYSIVLLEGLTPGVDVQTFGHTLATALQKRCDATCLGVSDFQAALARDRDRSDALYRELSHRLSRLEDVHDVVILLADPEPSWWTPWCQRQADLVLCVARASESMVALPQEGDDELAPRPRELVLVQDPDRPPRDTASWLSRVPSSSHHHIREGVVADVERLARRLTGDAVALALGGGGARGAAHIGVVRAFREAGIPIDLVGGTSVGAVIGAQVAMEWPIEKMAEEMTSWVKKKPSSDYTVPFVSLLAGRRAERMMKETFGAWNIEDLWRSFFCVASNLTQARAEVFRDGPLWRAIRASASLPGVLPPVLKRGDVLVDGCVLNNLPGDIMHGLHRCRVVSVNVSPATDLRVDPSLEAYAQGWRLWPRLLRQLFTKSNDGLPLLPEILMRSGNVPTVQRSNEIERVSTLYLAPDVGPYRTLDWGHFDAIEEIGYQAAVEALPSSELARET